MFKRQFEKRGALYGTLYMTINMLTAKKGDEIDDESNRSSTTRWSGATENV